MKKSAFTLFALAASLSLLFIACSKDSDDDNGGSGGNVIRMSTGTFTPETLQVKTGTTVTWINDSDDTHAVFSAEEAIDSGDMLPGSTYSHRFATAGTYNYQCTIHRGAAGVVIVSN